MSKKSKLKVDLGDSPDPIFSDEVTIIVNSLNKYNSDFTGLLVLPSVIEGQLVNYNKIRLAPAYDTQVAETAEARIPVQKSITLEGNWLNSYCDGNLVLLKRTGFPFQKEGEAQGKLDQTTITVNTVPNTSNVEFYISHIKGSGIHYGIMITTADSLEKNPSKWSFYYASQREGTLINLLANTAYKMVSFAMGTDKELTYSAEVEITTL
jgi:hypothetical protein